MENSQHKTIEDCIVDHYLAYYDRLKDRLPVQAAYTVAVQLLMVQKLHEISERFDLPELTVDDLIPDDDWLPLGSECLGMVNLGDK